MSAAREIASSYTLSQIYHAGKEAQAQGDTVTAALYYEAYDLRFDVLLAELKERRVAGGFQ